MRITTRSAAVLGLILLGLGAAAPAQAQRITPANDSLGTQVDFNPATQTYTINGGTQVDANLFHSFQQFGLSTHEIADFLANPNISNILARVTGGQASVIDGLLRVSGGDNANLFLINPAGVLLGRNASLNLAGSFSLSTASGLAFEDGIFSTTAGASGGGFGGNPSGYVFLGGEGVLLNEADLAVSPGQGITLTGGSVINTGSLTAPEGRVAIAAVPDTGLLQISQAGLVLSLAVPTEQVAAMAAAGDVTALDLPTLLAGDWGGAATTVATRADGAVVLSSGTEIPHAPGTATVTGQIAVSGSQGGQLQVLGETVTLTGATLLANGEQGGGEVLIGGEYLGHGDLPTAQTTRVDSTTRIAADAGATGDGGRVIVWADGHTDFGGQISAQGGALSGNGGFVETSGAQSLTVGPTARVVTTAANGDWGTWLLDPLDLFVIPVGGTAAISGGVNDPLSSIIDAGTIVAALGESNVTLQATNSITVNAPIVDTNTVPFSGNNLTLNTPTVNLNNRITLRSGGRLFGTADTVNVGGGGSVGNALDVAAPEATVNIAAGIFSENSSLEIWRPVTLTGAGAGSTILSGNNTHRVLEVRATFTGTVALNDLTVANGNPVNGSGGGFLNLSYPTVNLVVNNSTFTNNQAPANGGGISSNAPVVVNNSTITNNSAGAGGGGINAFRGLVLNNTIVSNNTSVSAGGGIRSFGTATLNDSIVSGNSTLGGLANAHGGGIYTEEPLTLNNSTVTGNSSIRDGGGIRGFGAGTIQIIGSTISNNAAAVNGGGISGTGDTTIVLVDSTVSDNTAGNDGGGLWTRFSSLNNSTISGNQAGNDGGGIYSVNAVNNNFVLNNTTVSGNTADRHGGGINGRDIILNNSTIAFNRADGNNSGAGDGGGLFIQFNNNNIIRNSIIANNVDLGGEAPDIRGNLGASQLSHNLIQTTAGITNGAPVDGVNGNVVGQDPLLAPLANNGGPTQTHSLGAGSLTIDGSDINALPTDQRGVAAVGIRDMGAFESNLAPTAPTPEPPTAPTPEPPIEPTPEPPTAPTSESPTAPTSESPTAPPTTLPPPAPRFRVDHPAFRIIPSPGMYPEFFSIRLPFVLLDIHRDLINSAPRPTPRICSTDDGRSQIIHGDSCP